MESSLPVAQIDFSQPITSTEEEGNRNKGNEEAFSSDQSAIAVTEGEEIEPKTVKDAEWLDYRIPVHIHVTSKRCHRSPTVTL